MKNGYVGMMAMLLCSAVGTVTAQPRQIPAGCPAVAPQKSAVKTKSQMTPEQAAADGMIAEAQTAMRVPSGENVAKTISLYEQAIRTDARNAAAYVSLARAHLQSQRYLSVPKKMAVSRAWENLSRGRALDPSNIDAVHILADQVIANHHDYKCAKELLESALQVDPQNARTLYYYSQILGGMGRFDLAFAAADKAMAVADADSRNFVVVNAGRLRYMAGNYDWVLDHYAGYLESNPDHPLAHFYRSLAFGAKGQYQEALVEAKKSMPVTKGGDAGGVAMLALAYARAGQKEQARELLTELLQRDGRGEHVVEYRIAALYEVLGERDEAFRWLGKDVDDRDGLGSWLIWLDHDPVWKDLRSDPRFKEIQRRTGW